VSQDNISQESNDSENSVSNMPTAETSTDLLLGTVKWFNDAKGFGFLEHIDGQDVFVHFSVIETEGFKTLKDGEEVRYSIKQGPKGLHAARVVRSEKYVKKAKEQAEAKKSLASQIEKTNDSSMNENSSASMKSGTTSTVQSA
jgi:CspA family cold shock protein